MKILRNAIIGLLFILFVVSCKESVRKKFEFIGLEFGVKLNHKIIEGPRDPPVFHPELTECYEIQFENFEFDTVLVALTKNEISNDTKSKFNQEGVIWAAFFFSKAKKGEREMFNKSDFNRIVKFIESKYGAIMFNEKKSESDSGLIISATLRASNVFFQLEVNDYGSFSEKKVVIKNFDVLRECGNEAFKTEVDESLNNISDIQKRRIY